MENVENIEKDYENIRKRKFLHIIYILIIVLLISIPVFQYFKINSGSHLALREAKNVKLACDMLNVEMYGTNKAIYNPLRENGLTEGVEERLLETTESKGEIRLLSYDKERRKVLLLTYETGRYRVTYTLKDGVQDHWKVEYLLTLAEHGGK